MGKYLLKYIVNLTELFGMIISMQFNSFFAPIIEKMKMVTHILSISKVS